MTSSKDWDSAVPRWRKVFRNILVLSLFNPSSCIRNARSTPLLPHIWYRKLSPPPSFSASYSLRRNSPKQPRVLRFSCHSSWRSCSGLRIRFVHPDFHLTAWVQISLFGIYLYSKWYSVDLTAWCSNRKSYSHFHADSTWTLQSSRWERVNSEFSTS